MTLFTMTFLAFLILASAAAAHFKQRLLFMPLFLLTMFSLLVGLFAPGSLKNIAVILGLFAAAAGVSYIFREFLVIVLRGEASKAIQTAPLTASFGIFIILIYLLAATFAPWIAPFGEAEVVGSSYAPPDDTMLLGGDQLGRDLFSRIIYGARNTVGLSLATTALAFLIGSTLGLLAAIKGGWLDQLLGRTADVVMSIPSLIFALLLLSIVGTSTTNLILVIGFIYSPLIFRLSRSVAGNIVVMDYIEAARLRGESSWYLMTREILPNAMAPLIAEFGLRFCFVFLMVAALSFLGLGIQPPTADWGSMVRENATLISYGEITPLIPAAAIALLTVSVNFVVDWMLYRSSGLKV